MAILSSTELPIGRGGSSEWNGGQIVRRDTKVYRVKVDDKSHDAQYILNNAIIATPDPIPNDLDSHPTQSGLYCRRRHADQEDVDGWTFKVTCQFDNSVNPADAFPDPLDRATKYRIEFSQFTKAVIFDNEGLPIINTAADFYDPPIEEEDGNLILIATKNYDAADLFALAGFIADYQNSVNSDEFFLQPIGSIRLGRVTASDLQIENDVQYYAVSWPFEFRSLPDISFDADHVTVTGGFEPWDQYKLSEGYNALRTGGDFNTKYPLPNKEPKKLARDGTLAANSSSAYFFTKHRTKKHRPFSAIPL